MYKYGYGYPPTINQLGTLLNQIPQIPNGTPTAISEVTDTGFKVISSVATNSSTVVILEYGTAAGVYTNSVTAAESPLSSTNDVNFTITGLTPFTTYYFRIKATNSAGIAYSQEFAQKTLEPAIISDGNTVAWYDFATGITKDGSNFVSAWNSRIGANHLLQAVGTNQPLHTANGVLFDGVDNYMKSAAFTLVQPEFIYMVINQKTWKNDKTIIDGLTMYNSFLHQYTSSPNIRAFGGSAYSPTSDSLGLNKFKIIRLLFNGAISKLIVSNDLPIAGSWGTLPMGGVCLGCFSNGTSFSNIEIKEIIIRKVSDNSTNEAAIYNYLKNKYAL